MVICLTQLGMTGLSPLANNVDNKASGTVNATNFTMSVDTVKNMTPFNIRIDYAGGPEGIRDGSSISVKIDNTVNDLIKIVGSGSSSYDIYGDDTDGKAGTYICGNDTDGNYYLDAVFNDSCNNYYGGNNSYGSGAIAGWFEAPVYVEYKKDVTGNSALCDIMVEINGISVPVTIVAQPDQIV